MHFVQAGYPIKVKAKARNPWSGQITHYLKGSNIFPLFVCIYTHEAPNCAKDYFSPVEKSDNLFVNHALTDDNDMCANASNRRLWYSIAVVRQMKRS